jgi:hypothetical protein
VVRSPICGGAIPTRADGAALFGEIRNAVELTARQLAPTMGPARAVEVAVAAQTADKYDFVGTARVPKGAAAAVEDTAARALSGLKPEDIAPNGRGETPALVERERANDYKSALRGRWMTDESEGGLIRLDENGRPVRLRSGEWLRVPFSGAAVSPATPGPASPVPGAAVPGGT